ncbi:hypothetical protein L0222_00665 [bacterium]|nr:hypothetical protein [bacterium]MCI0606547.1 hypothetical protein [bacterium]
MLRKVGAAESLRELPRPGPDDRVYQIEAKEEVLERATTMLSVCRKVVLLDAFPTPLGLLRPLIERAHRRGVRVALKLYQPDRSQGYPESSADPWSRRNRYLAGRSSESGNRWKRVSFRTLFTRL